MFSKNIVFAIQYIKDNCKDLFLIIANERETKDFDIDEIENQVFKVREFIENYKELKIKMLNNQTDYYSYLLIDNKYIFNNDLDELIEHYSDCVYIDYRVIINNLDNFNLTCDNWTDEEIMLLKLLGV